MKFRRLHSLLSERLTPDQRQVKKDFKHRAAQQNNPVPSFDEVWAEIEQSEGLRDEFRDLDYDEDEDERAAEIKQELYSKYRSLINEYEAMDGQDCWRCVKIPFRRNPLTHPQLGTYWTVEDQNAVCHWGHRGKKGSWEASYHGRIDVKNIDWVTTLHNRLDLSLGDEETEISFLPNSPIYIYSVEISDPHNLSPHGKIDGTTQIDAMRRC